MHRSSSPPVVPPPFLPLSSPFPPPFLPLQGLHWQGGHTHARAPGGAGGWGVGRGGANAAAGFAVDGPCLSGNMSGNLACLSGNSRLSTVVFWAFLFLFCRRRATARRRRQRSRSRQPTLTSTSTRTLRCRVGAGRAECAKGHPAQGGSCLRLCGTTQSCLPAFCPVSHGVPLPPLLPFPVQRPTQAARRPTAARRLATAWRRSSERPVPASLPVLFRVPLASAADATGTPCVTNHSTGKAPAVTVACTAGGAASTQQRWIILVQDEQ